jgi:Ulp1 family protease
MKFIDYDRIVIPDNEERQFHWAMHVIYLQQKSIVYYNSFNVQKANKNPELLLTFLEKMCQIDNVYFDKKDWKIILAKCPLQVLYYYI